jgi:hypothetical protein
MRFIKRAAVERRRRRRRVRKILQFSLLTRCCCCGCCLHHNGGNKKENGRREKDFFSLMIPRTAIGFFRRLRGPSLACPGCGLDSQQSATVYCTGSSLVYLQHSTTGVWWNLPHIFPLLRTPSWHRPAPSNRTHKREKEREPLFLLETQ